MTPTHLAILGRQPELGLIELESLCGSQNVTLFGKTASLIQGVVELDRLGGVIKLAAVLYQGPKADILSLELDWAALMPGAGKTTFGLSYYGARTTPRFVLAVGLELKKRLKAVGGSVRLVSPVAGSELTAAQIHHNKLLTEGFELLVVMNGTEMVVARTVAVQDIEAYAARDHGRPARSATVGMLPPKLTQIMLNTTSAPVVVDPFCGTGVVLQEALLAGRAAIGFDVAPEMVTATTTNLDWLAAQTTRPLPAWHVEAADARTGSLPEVALAMVSEGYLGRNLSSSPSGAEVMKLDDETSDLYGAVLKHWAKQLPIGTELALCLPNWRVASGWHVPAVVDDIARLGYTFKVFKRVSGPVRYARPDQIVGRQLLFLTRS